MIIFLRLFLWRRSALPCGMAKKPRVVTAGGKDLRSNPFASLGGQLGDLPAGDATAVVVPEPDSGSDAAADMFAGKLVVRREKKGRGGKVATIVDGLRGTASELDELARELRRALGAGAHVEDGRVVVSGVHTQKLHDVLRERGARTVVIGN